MDYMDNLEEQKCQKAVATCISVGRKQRQQNIKKCTGITKELSRRQALKIEKNVVTDRKEVGRKIKSLELNIKQDFLELDCNAVSDLKLILSGKAISRNICHVWYDCDTQDKCV